MRARKWSLSFAPRRWQLECLRAWEVDYRGIASVITGAGKTGLALMCMLRFAGEFPDGRVVIVVPTRALVDQWYVALQEDLSVSEDDIAVYSAEERPGDPRIVNLMVINTARRAASFLASQYDTLLIVDECHRAGSPVNALALQGPHRASMGLSATPVREYDSGLEEYLVPALGPIIYEYNYERAYQDGVISPFRLVNVRVDLLSDEQKEFQRLTRRIAIAQRQREAHGEANADLKRLLLWRAAVVSSAAMRIPVASKLIEMNRGQRTLVFHERVDAAESILRVLTERGHSATIYHSKIGPHLRRSNLRLYRKGVFDVLVTCRALDEGLSVPETTVGIIASSTASSRQRIQRLGRVLRPAPDKDAATIYTIYATDREERRLLEEARELKDTAMVSWNRSFRRSDTTT